MPFDVKGLRLDRLISNAESCYEASGRVNWTHAELAWCLRELRRFQALKCETCKFANEWDDMMPPSYLWCVALEVGFHNTHYCSDWQAVKEGTGANTNGQDAEHAA